MDDFDTQVQCEEFYGPEGNDLEYDEEGDDLEHDDEGEPWDGDWEGADAEVLASAGMGTDEDYGYYGSDSEEW